jgi:predicted transcriptional regulator
METSLLELAANIVTTHASSKEIKLDQLMDEIKRVYAKLKGIEQGDGLETEQKPAVTIEQAFQKDQVVCMICGKAGMTTLKRHLTIAHDMKPGQYKKQFNISADQTLAAADYVEKRRQMALDRGLADNLAKARAAKITKTKKEKK